MRLQSLDKETVARFSNSSGKLCLHSGMDCRAIANGEHLGAVQNFLWGVISG